MQITMIENTKQLPKCEMRCYSLTHGETVESAADKFEQYYRIKPERGHLFENDQHSKYIYFEVV